MYVCVYFHTRVVFRNAPCSINLMRHIRNRTYAINGRSKMLTQFLTYLARSLSKRRRARLLKIRECTLPSYVNSLATESIDSRSRITRAWCLLIYDM